MYKIVAAARRVLDSFSDTYILAFFEISRDEVNLAARNACSPTPVLPTAKGGFESN